MTRNFGDWFTKPQRVREFVELEKRLAEQEKLGSPVTPPANPIDPQPVLPIVNPIAVPSNTYWTIPGVKYRGNFVDVEVLKTLLDNGNSKTQDDWAKYSVDARKKGDFYIADYPLFYATLETACSLKSNPTIEEFRKEIQKISRARWLMTLTRIKYNDKGKDSIVHDYSLPTKYEFTEPFVGTDGVIPAGSPVSLYQKLLGTDSSLDKIKGVFNWLNGTDTYIWRLNSKPKGLDERIARFYASSYRAYLDCYGDPSYTIDGLGVRIARRVAPSVSALSNNSNQGQGQNTSPSAQGNGGTN